MTVCFYYKKHHTINTFTYIEIVDGNIEILENKTKQHSRGPESLSNFKRKQSLKIIYEWIPISTKSLLVTFCVIFHSILSKNVRL